MRNIGTMGNYPVFRRAVPHFAVCIHVLLSRSPVPLRAPWLACRYPRYQRSPWARIKLSNLPGQIALRALILFFKIIWYLIGLDVPIKFGTDLFETTLRSELKFSILYQALIFTQKFNEKWTVRAGTTLSDPALLPRVAVQRIGMPI